MNLWPFRHRHDPDTDAADRQLDVLDGRIAAASRAVDDQVSRVDTARSRAETAAARRAKAIAENHFDRLFITDLRGGHR